MDGLETYASYVPGDWPETWAADDRATIVFDYTNLEEYKRTYNPNLRLEVK